MNIEDSKIELKWCKPIVHACIHGCLEESRHKVKSSCWSKLFGFWTQISLFMVVSKNEWSLLSLSLVYFFWRLFCFWESYRLSQEWGLSLIRQTSHRRSSNRNPCSLTSGAAHYFAYAWYLPLCYHVTTSKSVHADRPVDHVFFRVYQVRSEAQRHGSYGHLRISDSFLARNSLCPALPTAHIFFPNHSMNRVHVILTHTTQWPQCDCGLFSRAMTEE